MPAPRSRPHDGPVTASETPPPALAEIRDDFLALPEPERLQLLAEFARELPPVPTVYDAHPDMFERVSECQSPVYVLVDVDPEGTVAVYATAPPEAPTTRGFASILCQGVTGLSVEAVLAIPDDFPQSIGLSRAVSPLRLAGMSGMLRRVKRRVRERR